MEYLRKSYFLIELHDTCKIDQMEYSMATIWSTPYASYIQPCGVLHRYLDGVLHVVIKTVFVEYSTGWRYGVLHVAYKWNFMEYLRNSYFLIELHDRCKIGHMEYSMATIWFTPYGTYRQPYGVLNPIPHGGGRFCQESTEVAISPRLSAREV